MERSAERAVADLAAVRESGASGFANTERREVVMQNETLAGLATGGIAVEILAIRRRARAWQARQPAFRRAKKAEEPCARGQQPDFRCELAEVMVAASVATFLTVEDADAEMLFFCK